MSPIANNQGLLLPKDQVQRVLSIIVVSFQMRRQISNTVRSLLPPLQEVRAEVPYEIIVVDNGSTDPPTYLADLENVSVIEMKNPTMSPGPAINFGVAVSQGTFVGLIPDGARMVSPGLIAGALKVLQEDENSIVGTYAYHLGNEPQQKSVATGYSTKTEEALLSRSGWTQNSTVLFDISVLEDDRFFPGTLPPESTATFLSRDVCDGLRGMNETFRTPGGGLVNHDFWMRCCAYKRSSITMLSTEGTFHQVHGGVSTNSAESKWGMFEQEFESITGAKYQEPRVRYRIK